jgi:hypothetical protein
VWAVFWKCDLRFWESDRNVKILALDITSTITEDLISFQFPCRKLLTKEIWLWLSVLDNYLVSFPQRNSIKTIEFHTDHLINGRWSYRWIVIEMLKCVMNLLSTSWWDNT